MSEELRACPCCKQDVEVGDAYSQGVQSQYCATCTVCHMRGPWASTRKVAAQRWNAIARPPVDSVGVDRVINVLDGCDHICPASDGTYETRGETPEIAGMYIDKGDTINLLRKALTAPADGKPCETCGGSKAVWSESKTRAGIRKDKCPDCTTEGDT